MNHKTDEQNCYHDFATHYDKFMSASKKYAVWEKMIAQTIAKYAVPKGLCLDVACGTGAISQMLIKRGFKVIGIDKSAEMLAIARKKLPDAQFIEADIRQFRVEADQPAVMAVSFYDSLNYLLEDEDMVAMFKSVRDNLAPGGIFLFDMNSREHMEISQKNNARVFEYDDLMMIMRFSGEGRIWILDIDMFTKKDNNLYVRSTERHIERGYDEEDIAPLLKQAGLTLLEARKEHKVYEDGKEHLSRWYFLVQK